MYCIAIEINNASKIVQHYVKLDLYSLQLFEYRDINNTIKLPLCVDSSCVIHRLNELTWNNIAIDNDLVTLAINTSGETLKFLPNGFFSIDVRFAFNRLLVINFNTQLSYVNILIVYNDERVRNLCSYYFALQRYISTLLCNRCKFLVKNLEWIILRI